jgi:hypothetical protein
VSSRENISVCVFEEKNKNIKEKRNLSSIVLTNAIQKNQIVAH